MQYIFFEKYLRQAKHYLKYAQTVPFYLKKKNFTFTAENTIVVFAQPRGGSTWFTDMLFSIPSTAKIDGPLYQGPFLPDGKMPEGKVAKLKSFKKLGFYFYQYIPETEEHSEARSFFHRLFSHGFFSPYIFQETPFLRLFRAKKFVFKFYQANLLLPWLIRNFDIKPIVLFRNPYATVASQMSHYAFQETIKTGKFVLPDFQYSAFFGPYREIFAEITKPEEILAAIWCLNYLPIVCHKGNNNQWLTISYEGLVLHKKAETERLFAYLGEKVPENLDDYYNKSSSATNKEASAYKDRKGHLLSWKKSLNEMQIDNITRILDRFNVRGYSTEVEPDYNYIYNGENRIKE